MKAGLTREEWAAEVARQNTEKADYTLIISGLLLNRIGMMLFPMPLLTTIVV